VRDDVNRLLVSFDVVASNLCQMNSKTTSWCIAGSTHQLLPCAFPAPAFGCLFGHSVR
jgi:hypothetical protein